jgi:hypothetical protein
MDKLPWFMESIASRSALRQISGKSLKMNKFAELAFCTPESSFSQRNWDHQYLSRTMRSGKNFPKKSALNARDVGMACLHKGM